MPPFPRTIVPNGTDAPQTLAAPYISRTRNSKRFVRPTLGGGFGWSEHFPPLDASLATVRAFLFDIDYFYAQAITVQVRPYHWSVAGGTIPTDATGAVNGAPQSGTSLITDGWTPGGTIAKGSYLHVAGVGHAVKVMAPAGADGGGNITFSIDPPIWLGNSPADDAVVTLNGLLDCHIVEAPRWPRVRARNRTFYRDLEIRFEETRE